MKYIAVALAAAGLVAAQADPITCALTCVTEVSAGTECEGVADPTCQCSQSWQAENGPAIILCFQNTCPDVAEQAIQLGQEACASVPTAPGETTPLPSETAAETTLTDTEVVVPTTMPSGGMPTMSPNGTGIFSPSLSPSGSGGSVESTTSSPDAAPTQTAAGLAMAAVLLGAAALL